jgi:hypothetical protein
MALEPEPKMGIVKMFRMNKASLFALFCGKKAAESGTNPVLRLQTSSKSVWCRPENDRFSPAPFLQPVASGHVRSKPVHARLGSKARRRPASNTASRLERGGFHPQAVKVSVVMKLEGTSPFQPIFPPVGLSLTPFSFITSNMAPAVSLIVIWSTLPMWTRL